MKFADSKCEWAQVIRGLEALQQVEATFQEKRFVLRSQLTSEASAALRATGVAAPPHVARVVLTARLGENVVPKRFGVFISTSIIATYIFEVLKTSLGINALFLRSPKT